MSRSPDRVTATGDVAATGDVTAPDHVAAARDVTAPSQGTAPDEAQPTPPADPPVAEPGPPAAPWWRHLGVVVALALLPIVGLGFCALIAMVILFSDQRRNPYTRLGGTLLIGWWTFTWARAGIPPLIGLALMGATAAAFGVAAFQQRPDRPALLRNAALATVSGLLAVLNVVPWGTRSATISEDDALRRALAASDGQVRATHAQIAATRERVTQRPYYAIFLFEPNATTKATADGEPCFRRAELRLVDGIDGAIDRRDPLSRLVPLVRWNRITQAREKDGFCLPLPRGTSRDIVPLPAG